MSTDLQELSAFAVYSGQALLSKNQKRKRKLKEIGKLKKASDKKPVPSSLQNGHSKATSSPLKRVNKVATLNDNSSKNLSKKQKKQKEELVSAIKLLKSVKDQKKPSDEEECKEKTPTKSPKKRRKKNKKNTPTKSNENGALNGEIKSDDEISVDEISNEKSVFEFLVPDAEVSRGPRKEYIEKFLERASLQYHGKILPQDIALSEVLHPVKFTKFKSNHWEKAFCHVERADHDRYKYLGTMEELDSVLRNNVVMFGKDLDVTSYTEGIRETHNLEGRAHANVVWDFFRNGCSVRLLSPAKFFPSIHSLCANLQTLFGCFVGANVYLTPSNSQGFAPHYDDIEAFVLQIEGSKMWKLYEPRTESEVLPRYSSPNFTQDEIGEPIFQKLLKPGDMLYFPRGMIHQAEAGQEHSLHVTISVYQKTAWIDLLEKALPIALKKAAAEDVEFRKGLPLGYLNMAGLAVSSDERPSLVQTVHDLFGRLKAHLDVASAVDVMGTQFLQESLGPVLTQEERENSVHEGGLKFSKGQFHDSVFISVNTKVRVIRENLCRFVQEESEEESGRELQYRLYYSIDNGKYFGSEDPQFLVIPDELADAVIAIVSSYPSFIKVNDLPCEDDDQKINLVGDLLERGILMFQPGSLKIIKG